MLVKSAHKLKLYEPSFYYKLWQWDKFSYISKKILAVTELNCQVNQSTANPSTQHFKKMPHHRIGYAWWTPFSQRKSMNLYILNWFSTYWTDLQSHFIVHTFNPLNASGFLMEGWVGGGRWVGCSSLVAHASATLPIWNPFHLSYILSVMPSIKNIRSKLNPLCANNAKTHYKWSP